MHPFTSLALWLWFSVTASVLREDEMVPQVIAKLESTLTRLDSAAGNADAILGENRAAIHNFANDGLGQLGPTLVELRALIGDLRVISDRISGSPPRFLLGRDAPKEYEPE